MLPPDELRALADDIASHGLLHAITLDDQGRVLDGRNRLAACEIAGIEPIFSTYGGDDPLSFVISENIKRRHLTEGQKAAVPLAALPLFEERAKARQSHGQTAPGRTLGADRRTASKGRATNQAAKAAGTSGRSVARAKRIKSDAPDLWQQVETGKLSLDRAERITRDRAAEQKRLERAQREAEARAHIPRIDIRLGDFREVRGDIEVVDVIITDPPFGAEWLHLLDDLAP